MKFKVLSRLKHNGEVYKPGQEIEVGDNDRKFNGKELVSSGVLKRIKEKPQEKPQEKPKPQKAN